MKNNDFPIYSRLLRFVKPYLWVFALGLVGTILMSLGDAGLTVLIKPLINGGVGMVNHSTAFKALPFLMLGIILARCLAGFLSNYCLGYVGKTVVRDFRQKIFKRILILPVSYFDQHGSGGLISKVIYNVDQLAQASSTALLILFREGVLSIALLAIMFWESWQITLLFMLIAPLVYIAIRYFSRVMRRLSRGVQDTMADVTHIVEEGILANREVRIYQGCQYESDRMNVATNTNRKRSLKIVASGSLHTSIIQIMLTLPMILILYLVIHSYFHITIGGLALIVTAMLQLPRPARRLTNVNADIQRGLAAAESIFCLLDEPSEASGSMVPATKSLGEIEFKNVNFAYNEKDDLVLQQISFKVGIGQSIALVGKSGSGKSSCVNLIPRFYNPSSGGIYLDGVNIQELDTVFLRSQMACVSQHTVLFNDTIFNNIAYAKNHVTKEAVILAAKQASIYDFITSLPDGFDTMVGDNGILLSGGQRQRVAIARAILKNAPILILDEATSSLDTESEKAIQSALDNLVQNRSTIMIAHRLSTIVNADKILVIDSGRIIESGNHHELIALNGSYANLYRLQQTTTKQEVIC